MDSWPGGWLAACVPASGPSAWYSHAFSLPFCYLGSRRDNCHRQLQPDVVRRRANEDFIVAWLNHVLLFIRVPVTQARGRDFNSDRLGFTAFQLHPG